MSSTLTGIVVSSKTPQIVTVAIETTLVHPRYKKTIKKTNKVHAHNEIEGIVVGDMVEIRPCRPISKTKHHIVVKKVS